MTYDAKPNTVRLPQCVDDRVKAISEKYRVPVAEVLRNAIIAGLPECERMIAERDQWILEKCEPGKDKPK